MLRQEVLHKINQTRQKAGLDELPNLPVGIPKLPEGCIIARALEDLGQIRVYPSYVVTPSKQVARQLARAWLVRPKRFGDEWKVPLFRSGRRLVRLFDEGLYPELEDSHR